MQRLCIFISLDAWLPTNISASANVTESVSASFYSRRSSPELFSETLRALLYDNTFCYPSIRGEPILSWKLVFYFLTHINANAQHAPRLLAIVIVTVFYLNKPTPEEKQALPRAFK